MDRAPCDGQRAKRRALLGRHRRGGRLLDDLLVAPLDRAVALAEVDDVAVAVADDLHLDVPAALQVFLDVELVAAEGALRLGLRRGEDLAQAQTRSHHAHAAPAAAGRRLENDGVADLGASSCASSSERSGRLVPGQDGQPRLGHLLARHRLVAHRRDDVGVAGR